MRSMPINSMSINSMFLKQPKGFTLLELLVVIVLLGIVLSFTMLSINLSSLETELEEEANKLHALINLVKEEAIIQAQEIALEVDKQGYLFLGLEGDKWQPLQNKVFRKREIHQGFKISLELESAQSLFKKDEDEDDDEEEPVRVFFLSSGEITPFNIKLALEENEQVYYQLHGDFSGNVTIEKNTNSDF